MKLVELNPAHDLSQGAPQSRSSAPHSWQARIDQLLTDLRPLVRPAPVLRWPLPAQWERDDDGLADAKTRFWDPVQIDARLDQLTNHRWLRPWQRRGEPGVMAALIDEVDATGVDRHTIAARMSPEALRTIEHNCFQQRAQLVATGPLPVPSYQHLLLQAVQEAVLQLATVTRPQTGAGGTRVPADYVWQVGDVVSYCREMYVVAEITKRALLLESELSGSVDIHFASDDLGRLRLVAQALQLRQP